MAFSSNIVVTALTIWTLCCTSAWGWNVTSNHPEFLTDGLESQVLRLVSDTTALSLDGTGAQIDAIHFGTLQDAWAANLLGSKLERISDSLSASGLVNDIIGRQVQTACGQPDCDTPQSAQDQIASLEVNRRIIIAGCGAINWAGIPTGITLASIVVSGLLCNGGVRCQIVIGIALSAGQTGLVSLTQNKCEELLQETAERCEGFGGSATCQILDGSDRSTIGHSKSVSTEFVDALGPCRENADAECASVEVDA